MIVLSGLQARWLIALCVSRSDFYREKLRSGRILFKGGSTVSCLTTVSFDTKLRLCGRITKNGLKCSLTEGNDPHYLVYENGTLRNADKDVIETVSAFGPDDVIITGANAIDARGNAGILFGSPDGGRFGECLRIAERNRVDRIILADTGKLITESIHEVSDKTDKENCVFSYGMSCSLVPISGRIITEIDALTSLTGTDAHVFARGGFTGAENAAAIQVSGEIERIQNALDIVEEARSLCNTVPVSPESVKECRYPGYQCRFHSGCVYSHKNKIKAKPR